MRLENGWTKSTMTDPGRGETVIYRKRMGDVVLTLDAVSINRAAVQSEREVIKVLNAEWDAFLLRGRRMA